MRCRCPPDKAVPLSDIGFVTLGQFNEVMGYCCLRFYYLFGCDIWIAEGVFQNGTIEEEILLEYHTDLLP